MIHWGFLDKEYICKNLFNHSYFYKVLKYIHLWIISNMKIQSWNTVTIFYFFKVKFHTKFRAFFGYMQIRLACVNKNAIWILNLNFITHKLSTKNEKQQKKCYCVLENVGVFIYFLSSLIEVVFSVDLNDLSNYERSLFVLFTASEEKLTNIKKFIAPT